MNTQTADAVTIAATAINAISAAAPKPASKVVFSTSAMKMAATDKLVCPKCGGRKMTRESVLCLHCSRHSGVTAEQRFAFEAAVKTARTALDGVVKAGLGTVERRTIWNLWTGIEMPVEAELKNPTADFSQTYVQAKIPLKDSKNNGWVDLSIFGEDSQLTSLEAGKVYFGILSLRERYSQKTEKWVKYLRFQLVSVGVEADTCLKVTGDPEEAKAFLSNLETAEIKATFHYKKKKLDCHVGFVAL